MYVITVYVITVSNVITVVRNNCEQRNNREQSNIRVCADQRAVCWLADFLRSWNRIGSLSHPSLPDMCGRANFGKPIGTRFGSHCIISGGKCVFGERQGGKLSVQHVAGVLQVGFCI